MKKILLFLFYLLFQSFLPVFSQEVAFVPGEIIVQIAQDEGISELVTKFNLKRNSQQILIKEQLSSSWNIYLLTTNPGSDLEVTLNDIRAYPGVLGAGLNRKVSNRAIPNDTHFSKMWDMNNTAQTGGVADADIDAIEAWEISTGGLTVTGDSIVVAVIDGGFSLTHQDLNFWKNRAEIPGNLIDDDLNGYVDDFNGWNALNDNGNITSDSHGTHVAGTVGAKGNNTIGVTGVNWNVKVMPIQGSSTTESVVIKAYEYIYIMRKLYNQTGGLKGAFVVSTNASFGVDYGQPADFPLWCGIYDSLGTVGVLSCGATANLNVNVDTQGDIPTACPSPYLISVTNTNKSDVKYTGAGYGLTTIDLGAPGTEIWSTVPGNAYAGGVSWTGTSMATPHVAGAIALMYAAACSEFMADYKLYPDSMALIMKEFLLSSTDSLPSLLNKTVTAGRLNLYKSLKTTQLYGDCGTSISKFNKKNVRSLKVFPNPANDQCEIHFFLEKNSDVEITLTDVLGRDVKKIFSTRLSSGLHSEKLDLSSIPQGLYLVSLKSNSGTSTVKVMVE